MPKKLKKVQFVQRTARSWSQWVKVTGSELCCHCGLVHQVQYGVKSGDGVPIEVHKRVRVHLGKTKQWRKQKVFPCRPA